VRIPEKSDYLAFFDSRRVANPLALTLTLKQRTQGSGLVGGTGRKIDPISISQNTRHFLNRVNQSVYSNGFTRYGKRLSVIPIIEGNYSVRYHVHMTLQKPPFQDHWEFAKLINDCWNKTSLGYKDIDVRTINDYSGWIDYKLKNRTKSEGIHSSVDWDNVFLH